MEIYQPDLSEIYWAWEQAYYWLGLTNPVTLGI